MPDVGFRLFGDSVQLERAVKSGKNSVMGLDATIRGVNKTMSALRRVTGILAIVAMFSAATSRAQELRDAAKASGEAIGGNTAAAARLGDSIDALKKYGTDFAISMVGGYQRIVEASTNWLLNLVGLKEAFDDEKMSVENLAALEDKIAKQREANFDAQAEDLKKHEQRMKEAGVLAKENNAADAKAWLEKQDAARQIEILRKAEVGLQQQIKSGTLGVLELEEARQALTKTQNDLKKKQGKIDETNNKANEEAMKKAEAAAEKQAQRAKELKAAQDHVAALKSEKNQTDADASKMTLQQLASKSSFSAGVSVDVGAGGAKAREIFELEKKRDELAAAGDSAGAAELSGKIKEGRAGLGNLIKSNEATPTAAADRQMADAQSRVAELGGAPADQGAGGWGVVGRSAGIKAAMGAANIADQVRAGVASPKAAAAGAGDQSKVMIDELKGIHAAVKGKFLAQ